VDPDKDQRWPRSVYGVGAEPDPRFSFANERTTLAWLRTALALIAAGVSVEVFLDPLTGVVRKAVAVLLLVLGVACSVGAFVRWARNERALRDRRPLPGSGLALTLAYALAAVGIVLCVVVLWGALR
jgi:putative membrane protein